MVDYDGMEIGQLLAENEQLRAAERNYQAAHDLQDEKIERLRAAINLVLRRCNDNGGEIDGLEVAELKEALEQKAGGK